MPLRVAVVAQAVAVHVGIQVVADQVVVPVGPFLRLQRKRILGVVHAVVVVVGVAVVGDAVMIDVRRSVGRDQQGQIDGELRRRQRLPAGCNRLVPQDRGGLRRVPVRLWRPPARRA